MTTGHSGRRVNAAPSKSLGEKRRRINDEQIDAITRLHGEFTEGEVVTLRGVSSVIRQLLSSSTPKGRIEWDPERRDTDHVPLTEDVNAYLEREVLPHVPDAHVAEREGKIGYEIPFTRLFYKYTPPRRSEEIKAELRENP